MSISREAGGRQLMSFSFSLSCRREQSTNWGKKGRQKDPTTMLSAEHSRHSGLSHLVEAATALTKLVASPPSAISQEAPVELQHGGGVVSDDDSQRKRSSKSTASKEIFPQRLMAILSDPTVSDVISWLPHGRSFVIIRPDCLSERVLTKYFASTDPRSSTKYPSFTRKLNRWGFRQATRGDDMGAFHHPLFRRDQPELCLDMVCQKSRKPKSSKPSDMKKAESSSSLPPKKRKMENARKQSPSPQLDHRVVSDASLSAQSSSGDEQSLSSASTSSSSTSQKVLNVPLLASLTSLPLSLTAAAAPAVAAAPIVVNDAKLVEAALKAREERERLSAARAMLFDAYVKALNGQ